MNLIIYFLLTCHFLADFYLQPDKLAENKKKNILYLLLHCAIYSIVLSIGIFLCFTYSNQKILTFMGICIGIFASHFFIDFIKITIEKKAKKSHSKFYLFIIDQILHILVIMFAIAFFKYFSYEPVNLNKYNILIKTIFLFLVLTKPASVFIKCTFNSFLAKSQSKLEEENSTEIKDAGQFIGILERAIISILLLLNQYGAIGLVLTAKSIARFKQLEDKNFAEKYLIGTLLSFIISLISTVAVINY